MPWNLPTGRASTNVVVGRELRQKLVIGDAGRGVEAGHLLDLGADRECDVARQRNVLQVFRDVKIGFVERERFYDRCVLGEDLADLLRDGLVNLEARFHEDQVGTLPLRRHRWHGGSHPKLAGFVARRGHDASLAGSADGDRLAAELRIVSLFDGCVEGVHVDVDDPPHARYNTRFLCRSLSTR